MKQKKLNWSHQDMRILSILKDGVRLSAYNKKVKRACERLYKKIKPLEEETEGYDLDLNTLTCISLLSEAYDQMGKIDLSYKLIQGCAARITRELSEMPYNSEFRPKMAHPEKGKKRKIIRQKLWCLMIKCHGDYRRGNYTEGLEGLNICEHVIFDVLKDDNPDDPFPLNGTRARLFYFKGLILSEQGDWSRADFCFQEAQFTASERLAEKRNSFEDDAICREAARKLRAVLGDTSHMDIDDVRKLLIEKENIYFRHCMGKLECFGFARNRRSVGELRQARHKLRIAELALADTQNSYMLDLVNLELGITLRALAGYEVKQLEESLSKLQSCSNRFKSEQEHYYIRSLIALSGTQIALAIAHRLRNRSEDHLSFFKQAEKTAKTADKKSKEFKGWHWRTKLLLSRIDLESGRAYSEKQKYEQAEQSLLRAEALAWNALEAANPVDSHKKELPEKMEMLKGMLESKIVLGEIYLELASVLLSQVEPVRDNARPGDERKMQSTKYLIKARDCFEKVRKLSNQTPMYDAVCALYLAKTYLVWKLYKGAKYEMEKWKSYENQIENKIIRDIGEQVESELQRIRQEEGSGPLIFKAESTDLNYKKLNKELFDWLVKQARIKLAGENKSTSQANIAVELGLRSRTSVQRRSAGKKKKEAETNIKA